MSDTEGRGVWIYIKTKLNALKVELQNNFKEYVCCQIKLNDHDQLIIGCFYRSPSRTRQDFINMSSLIKYIADLKPLHLLVMGDFNLREIYWSLGETSVGDEHIATLFQESIRASYLFQYVREPTRYRNDNIPSVLDLVFNTITVNNFASLFNCTPVGRASDSMMAST